ncbi:MAG: tRNA lysidine(34) synthetase TilS, partial [Hyphomicrobiales bacterium]
MPPRNIKEPAADTQLSGDEVSALIDPVLSAGPAALAVSGGPDSMQLMHMTAARKGAAKVHVLTVDHQLRESSAAEAEFVKTVARKLGLEHTTLRWEHPAPDSGLQERARAARYTLMAQWCRANHFEHLVTAHNLDDQAETLLMRLGRGSGPDGLAAMARRTNLFSITVLRPLLEVPHARLVASMKAAGHEYIDDPSNADLRFERVRIRNARAARDELGLSDKALSATALRMGRAVEALTLFTDEMISRCVQLSHFGHCSVNIASALDAPNEVTLRLLSACLTAIGGADWPPGDGQLEEVR